MKTIEEVLENYEDYRGFLDDRFGSRLCDFLTEEQANKIGFAINYKQYPDAEWPEPKEWTRENILKQLEKDVNFGFTKALDQRGISSNLMFNVVLSWNKVLEEGLEDWDKNDYAYYGLPLFRKTAVKYGWENPIGENSGREEEYNE
mgnify:CR=1 FL=1